MRHFLATLLVWLAVSQGSAAQQATDPVDQQPVSSIEAHALYKRALAALPDRDELQHLLDLATGIDENFAAAYALKAEHYAISIAAAVARSDDPRRPAELARLAIDNANKALGLDSASTAAYLALGLTHRQYWRWEQALVAYAQAYRLDPGDAGVLFNYGWLSSFSRQHEQAIDIAQRAVELFPDSPNAHRDLGIAQVYAGNAAAGVEGFRGCIARNENIGVCHIYLGMTQIQLGDEDQAVAALREAERLFGDSPSAAAMSSLAHAYSRTGRKQDAERLFEALQLTAETAVVGAGTWPLAYLAVDDIDNAYSWLERAVEKIEAGQPDEGFFNLMIIKANVQANPVLDEARFVALRDRIGASL